MVALVIGEANGLSERGEGKQGHGEDASPKSDSVKLSHRGAS
jgi:hypothetical protein